MDRIDRYDTLTNLSYRLNCGVGLLEVLHDALKNSGFSADSYAPAVNAVYEYLENVAQALEQLKNEESPDGSSPPRQ